MAKISDFPVENIIDGVEEIPLLAHGNNTRVSVNALRDWIRGHIVPQVNVTNQTNTFSRSYPVEGAIAKGQGFNVIRATDGVLKAKAADNSSEFEIIRSPTPDFASNVNNQRFSEITRVDGVKVHPIRDTYRDPTDEEVNTVIERTTTNTFTLEGITTTSNGNFYTAPDSSSFIQRIQRVNTNEWRFWLSRNVNSLDHININGTEYIGFSSGSRVGNFYTTTIINGITVYGYRLFSIGALNNITDGTLTIRFRRSGQATDYEVENRSITSGELIYTLTRVTAGDDSAWNYTAPSSGNKFRFRSNTQSFVENTYFVEQINIRDGQAYVAMSADSPLLINRRNIHSLNSEGQTAFLASQTGLAQGTDYNILQNGLVEWRIGTVDSTDIANIVSSNGKIILSLLERNNLYDNGNTNYVIAPYYGSVFYENPVLKNVNTDIYDENNDRCEVTLADDDGDGVFTWTAPEGGVEFRNLGFNGGAYSVKSPIVRLDGARYDSSSGNVSLQGTVFSRIPLSGNKGLFYSSGERFGRGFISVNFYGNESDQILFTGNQRYNFSFSLFNTNLSSEDRAALVSSGYKLRFDIFLTSVAHPNYEIPSRRFRYGSRISSRDSVFGKFLPISNDSGTDVTLNKVYSSGYFSQSFRSQFPLFWGRISNTKILVGYHSPNTIKDRPVSYSFNNSEGNTEYGFNNQEKTLSYPIDKENFPRFGPNGIADSDISTSLAVWERSNAGEWNVVSRFFPSESRINKTTGIESHRGMLYSSISVLAETDTKIIYGLFGNLFRSYYDGSYRRGGQGVDSTFPSSYRAGKSIILLEYEKSTNNFKYILNEDDTHLNTFIDLSQITADPNNHGIPTGLYTLSYNPGSDDMRLLIHTRPWHSFFDLDVSDYNTFYKQAVYTNVSNSILNQSPSSAYRKTPSEAWSDILNRNSILDFAGFRRYLFKNDTKELYTIGRDFGSYSQFARYNRGGNPDDTAGFGYFFINDALNSIIQTSYLSNQDQQWGGNFAIDDIFKVIESGSVIGNVRVIEGQAVYNRNYDRFFGRNGVFQVSTFKVNTTGFGSNEGFLQLNMNIPGGNRDFALRNSIYPNIFNSINSTFYRDPSSLSPSNYSFVGPYLRKIDVVRNGELLVRTNFISNAIGISTNDYSDGDTGVFALFRGSTIITLPDFNLVPGVYYGLNASTGLLERSGTIRVGQAISLTDIIIDR